MEGISLGIEGSPDEDKEGVSPFEVGNKSGRSAIIVPRRLQMVISNSIQHRGGVPFFFAIPPKGDQNKSDALFLGQVEFDFVSRFVPFQRIVCVLTACIVM